MIHKGLPTRAGSWSSKAHWFTKVDLEYDRVLLSELVGSGAATWGSALVRVTMGFEFVFSPEKASHDKKKWETVSSELADG
ncbi:hypothetical protein KY290_025217 [Solanum tuberosum]|uniref:Uncharacterized protein n=1 Tax=Solanum tuberosum TaxID=4113 RepID=A0ABQ7USX7_SOLTU|nr:hypothetical protein KY284_024022 [Solanum tuberosum]KAH0754947.1 hypothetical protein KY290_025217 [Solanum tuberosum]